MRENTSGRALWVVWCCMWAGVWLVAAGFGNGGHLGLALAELVLAVGSGAAIALPVGKNKSIPRNMKSLARIIKMVRNANDLDCYGIVMRDPRACYIERRYESGL